MGIGVYPRWSKSAFQTLFYGEDPFVFHLIQVPKMYFDFQTPDHWKGGELAYVHEHTNWGVIVVCVINPAGAHKFFGTAKPNGKSSITNSLRPLGD